MRVYYFLGLLLRPFAVMSLTMYSRVFGTSRARVVLKNDQGQILFLQSWLSGNKWGFPGGGVGRGESPAAAAVRELKEETGIVVPEDELHPECILRAGGHEEVVFSASISNELPSDLPNRFEVKKVGWFSVDNVPLLEPLAQKILDRVVKEI